MDMRIAVCDDCRKDAELLCGQLERYCRENGLAPFAVEVFDSGLTFSERCAPGRFDLVFMDIYLKNSDGMRVVRELRKLDPDCLVVFFTRSADHAVEAFEVNAAHYLTKPLAYEKLALAVDRCRKLREKQGRFLLLRTDKALRKVLLQEVVFAEVFDNISVVHLERESVQARIPLKDLETEIGQAGGEGDFLRCHRSALVNMNRIIALRGDFFLMDTGMPVPISKYNRKRIVRAYEDFALGKMRDSRAVGAGT